MYENRFPWQTKQWDIFLKRFENKNLPHALLLSGPKGLGKQQFALQISKLLLCEQAQDHYACERCSSCALYDANNHPDFSLLSKENNSKVIKIDAIRDLSKKLQTSAQRGGRKVTVISEGDSLNHAASNALLKTLEEPCKDTYIILLSQHPENMLATLRSRTQEIKFTSSQHDASLKWLKEQGVASPRECFSLAEYAPLLALEYANDETLRQQYHQFMKCLQEFYQHYDPLQMAALCCQLEANCLLSWLSQFYMDLIRLSAHVDEKHLVHGQYLSFLRSLISALSMEQIFTMYDEVISKQKLLHKQSNLNLQLLLESLFIALSNNE